MGELYQLSFPESGKSYIGITTKTAKWRYKSHSGSINSGNYPLYNAWKKYGKPELKVLARLENDDLYDTEIRAIAALNTRIPNGYNVSPGGECSPMLIPGIAEKVAAKNRGKERSPGAIENMRKAITGRHLSEEHKEKIGLAGIGRKFSPESIAKMKAYEFSDGHRESLSLSARGNKNGTGNCNSRPVLDTKTGEVFICAALAAKTRGIKRTTLHNWLNDISIPKNEAPDRYCYLRSDS